jgi:molecular chaperone DnaK
VQTKNIADAQIHDARKELADSKSVTEEIRTGVEDAIKAVEEAVKAEDVAKIQESVGKLVQLTATLKQPAPEAEVQSGATTDSAGPADNVVDAEFTEVKKDAE